MAGPRAECNHLYWRLRGYFGAKWAGKATAFFQTYQGESGGQPDYVLFRSGQPHPVHCQPESDPTIFCGVIDAYVDATK
jgi:hypothetical protein